ncbi:M48 family metalloprotease [Luteimonas viscosa]|uniref:M48 family metalloprotease n=1 Tax=Luteimonas viscosa TaxID=1132694 RepID=A0A5D4XQ16_9GAMM|nr:M48 family metalloprotease [Luteimonas viscosa]TYT26659.1 M48 family metalloprotease [Luteimonas viscosa]
MASAEAYRGLVERLEVVARQSPGGYRLRVALLAALGFVVLGGSVLLAFGLSVGLVLALLAISPLLLLKLAKLVWIPIAFGWVVLRALWVTFPAPEGHRLDQHEAPLLQAEVERLRVAAGAPRLSGIVVDADLNAAAASVPRALGLLGHRHYLVLGLPLMQLLDREQFASVVAHEFGHFGGGHGRFGGWIYRVRASWYRLLDALAVRQGWVNRLFVRFFDWYAPYFNAYSFVLARANEYQADATAARIAGARAAGEALVRVNLGSARLSQEFWPQLQRASLSQPAPPALLYREMGTRLRDDGGDDEARLAAALAAQPGFDDSHPTLAQRLQALGVAPVRVPPPRESAAEALLGELLPRLEQRFSEEWRAHIEAHWDENYRQHARDLERFEALRAQQVRSPQEAVEFAGLSERLVPEADAIALYRAAIEVAPDDPFARFRLGTRLLEHGEAEGIQHLRRAMTLDPECAAPALEALAGHYRETGDATALQGIEAEWSRLQASWARAQQARGALTARDEFLPHALDAAQVDAVCAALQRIGAVRKAWLARKRIVDEPHGAPHFVLLVQWRLFVLDGGSRLQRIVDAVELPGSFLVFTAPHQRAIARRLRKAAGAPILGGGRP